jgi:hypothetical protein
MRKFGQSRAFWQQDYMSSHAILFLETEEVSHENDSFGKDNGWCGPNNHGCSDNCHYILGCHGRSKGTLTNLTWEKGSRSILIIMLFKLSIKIDR